jgi:Ca-activated chloride channel family protein
MSSNKNETAGRLTVKQDRRLIRARWHSARFVVAHVTAPEVESGTERQPVNLAFVIDRSGSMAGRPIGLAMQAVEEAIRRLKASDRFSVVVYDDEVDTIVPGVFATKEAKAQAIGRLASVGARGATDLSGGWLRGCQLVATELMELGVNRTLLLTDGLANRGMTTLEELEHHAAELRKRGVSTSTFGVGDRFNEELLQAMAQAGGGQFYDIATPEQIRDHIES